MGFKTYLKSFVRFALPATLASTFLIAGCAVHARVYDDPYYHDSHPWNGEVVYYQQWERDTHHEHMDFNRRSDADKKAYWDWRHSHEHDNDRR